MGQREIDRHLMQQRENAEHRLHGNGRHQPQRAIDDRALSPRQQCIERVPDRHGEQQIGRHAVLELHRQRIVEHVAPPRVLEEQT